MHLIGLALSCGGGKGEKMNQKKKGCAGGKKMRQGENPGVKNSGLVGKSQQIEVA